jgi:hypothetical protein
VAARQLRHERTHPRRLFFVFHPFHTYIKQTPPPGISQLGRRPVAPVVERMKDEKKAAGMGRWSRQEEGEKGGICERAAPDVVSSEGEKQQ